MIIVEGKLQKVGDVEYIFYKQLGGDMLRVDICKGDITNIDEYKSYTVVDSYLNGDRITYYIKPQKDTYTDTTGVSYKTSSIYVYTDNNGNYRTFSDDTKKHLEAREKSLMISKSLLEKEQSKVNPNQKDIEMYKRWIKDSEKLVEKFKKDLMRGM